MRTPLCFLVVSLALIACGSGSSSTTQTEAAGTSPAGSCESAGTLLCQRACACSTDGKCYVATKTAKGATGALVFANEQKCRDLYVTFGCLGGGNTSIDYARCDSATAAASCVDSSSKQGILLPEECKSTQ